MEFLREKVIKVPDQMEALRIMNYPYQAIEEAVVNAFYHRDYLSYEPVTIEIEPDCINIMKSRLLKEKSRLLRVKSRLFNMKSRKKKMKS